MNYTIGTIMICITHTPLSNITKGHLYIVLRHVGAWVDVADDDGHVHPYHRHHFNVVIEA